MRWEVGGKKIASCTLIKMSWGGAAPNGALCANGKRQDG